MSAVQTPRQSRDLARASQRGWPLGAGGPFGHYARSATSSHPSELNHGGLAAALWEDSKRYKSVPIPLRELSRDPRWAQLYLGAPGSARPPPPHAMDDSWVDMKLAKLMLGTHFTQKERMKARGGAVPPTDDELLAKLAKETICQKPLDSPLRAARGKESNGRRETRENQPALLAQSPEEMFDVDESPAATPGYAREALAAADFALGQLENNQGGAGHGGSRTPARGTEQQKLEHYGAIPQHGEADGREPSTKASAMVSLMGQWDQDPNIWDTEGERVSLIMPAWAQGGGEDSGTPAEPTGVEPRWAAPEQDSHMGDPHYVPHSEMARASPGKRGDGMGPEEGRQSPGRGSGDDGGDGWPSPTRRWPSPPRERDPIDHEEDYPISWDPAGSGDRGSPHSPTHTTYVAPAVPRRSPRNSRETPLDDDYRSPWEGDGSAPRSPTSPAYRRPSRRRERWRPSGSQRSTDSSQESVGRSSHRSWPYRSPSASRSPHGSHSPPRRHDPRTPTSPTRHHVAGYREGKQTPAVAHDPDVQQGQPWVHPQQGAAQPRGLRDDTDDAPAAGDSLHAVPQRQNSSPARQRAPRQPHAGPYGPEPESESGSLTPRRGADPPIQHDPRDPWGPRYHSSGKFGGGLPPASVHDPDVQQGRPQTDPRQGTRGGDLGRPSSFSPLSEPQYVQPGGPAHRQSSLPTEGPVAGPYGPPQQPGGLTPRPESQPQAGQDTAAVPQRQPSVPGGQGGPSDGPYGPPQQPGGLTPRPESQPQAGQDAAAVPQRQPSVPGGQRGPADGPYSPPQQPGGLTPRPESQPQGGQDTAAVPERQPSASGGQEDPMQDPHSPASVPGAAGAPSQQPQDALPRSGSQPLTHSVTGHFGGGLPPAMAHDPDVQQGRPVMDPRQANPIGPKTQASGLPQRQLSQSQTDPTQSPAAGPYAQSRQPGGDQGSDQDPQAQAPPLFYAPAQSAAGAHDPDQQWGGLPRSDSTLDGRPQSGTGTDAARPGEVAPGAGPEASAQPSDLLQRQASSLPQVQDHPQDQLAGPFHTPRGHEPDGSLPRQGSQALPGRETGAVPSRQPSIPPQRGPADGATPSGSAGRPSDKPATQPSALGPADGADPGAPQLDPQRSGLPDAPSEPPGDDFDKYLQDMDDLLNDLSKPPSERMAADPSTGPPDAGDDQPVPQTAARPAPLRTSSMQLPGPLGDDPDEDLDPAAPLHELIGQLTGGMAPAVDRDPDVQQGRPDMAADPSAGPADAGEDQQVPQPAARAAPPRTSSMQPQGPLGGDPDEVLDPAAPLDDLIGQLTGGMAPAADRDPDVQQGRPDMAGDPSTGPPDGGDDQQVPQTTASAAPARTSSVQPPAPLGDDPDEDLDPAAPLDDLIGQLTGGMAPAADRNPDVQQGRPDMAADPSVGPADAGDDQPVPQTAARAAPPGTSSVQPPTPLGGDPGEDLDPAAPLDDLISQLTGGMPPAADHDPDVQQGRPGMAADPSAGPSDAGGDQLVPQTATRAAPPRTSSVQPPGPLGGDPDEVLDPAAPLHELIFQLTGGMAPALEHDPDVQQGRPEMAPPGRTGQIRSEIPDEHLASDPEQDWPATPKYGGDGDPPAGQPISRQGSRPRPSGDPQVQPEAAIAGPLDTNEDVEPYETPLGTRLSNEPSRARSGAPSGQGEAGAPSQPPGEDDGSEDDGQWPGDQFQRMPSTRKPTAEKVPTASGRHPDGEEGDMNEADPWADVPPVAKRSLSRKPSGMRQPAQSDREPYASDDEYDTPTTVPRQLSSRHPRGEQSLRPADPDRAEDGDPEDDILGANSPPRTSSRKQSPGSSRPTHRQRGDPQTQDDQGVDSGGEEADGPGGIPARETQPTVMRRPSRGRGPTASSGYDDASEEDRPFAEDGLPPAKALSQPTRQRSQRGDRRGPGDAFADDDSGQGTDGGQEHGGDGRPRAPSQRRRAPASRADEPPQSDSDGLENDPLSLGNVGPARKPSRSSSRPERASRERERGATGYPSDGEASDADSDHPDGGPRRGGRPRPTGSRALASPDSGKAGSPEDSYGEDDPFGEQPQTSRRGPRAKPGTREPRRGYEPAEEEPEYSEDGNGEAPRKGADRRRPSARTPRSRDPSSGRAGRPAASDEEEEDRYQPGDSPSSRPRGATKPRSASRQPAQGGDGQPGYSDGDDPYDSDPLSSTRRPSRRRHAPEHGVDPTQDLEQDDASSEEYQQDSDPAPSSKPSKPWDPTRADRDRPGSPSGDGIDGERSPVGPSDEAGPRRPRATRPSAKGPVGHGRQEPGADDEGWYQDPSSPAASRRPSTSQKPQGRAQDERDLMGSGDDGSDAGSDHMDSGSPGQSGRRRPGPSSGRDPSRLQADSPDSGAEDSDPAGPPRARSANRHPHRRPESMARGLPDDGDHSDDDANGSDDGDQSITGGPTHPAARRKPSSRRAPGREQPDSPDSGADDEDPLTPSGPVGSHRPRRRPGRTADSQSHPSDYGADDQYDDDDEGPLSPGAAEPRRSSSRRPYGRAASGRRTPEDLDSDHNTDEAGQEAAAMPGSSGGRSREHSRPDRGQRGPRSPEAEDVTPVEHDKPLSRSRSRQRPSTNPPSKDGEHSGYSDGDGEEDTDRPSGRKPGPVRGKPSASGQPGDGEPQSDDGVDSGEDWWPESLADRRPSRTGSQGQPRGGGEPPTAPSRTPFAKDRLSPPPSGAEPLSYSDSGSEEDTPTNHQAAGQGGKQRPGRGKLSKSGLPGGEQPRSDDDDRDVQDDSWWPESLAGRRPSSVPLQLVPGQPDGGKDYGDVEAGGPGSVPPCLDSGGDSDEPGSRRPGATSDMAPSVAEVPPSQKYAVTPRRRSDGQPPQLAQEVAPQSSPRGGQPERWPSVLPDRPGSPAAAVLDRELSSTPGSPATRRPSSKYAVTPRGREGSPLGGYPAGPDRSGPKGGGEGETPEWVSPFATQQPASRGGRPESRSPRNGPVQRQSSLRPDIPEQQAPAGNPLDEDDPEDGAALPRLPSKKYVMTPRAPASNQRPADGTSGAPPCDDDGPPMRQMSNPALSPTRPNDGNGEPGTDDPSGGPVLMRLASPRRIFGGIPPAADHDTDVQSGRPWLDFAGRTKPEEEKDTGKGQESPSRTVSAVPSDPTLGSKESPELLQNQPSPSASDRRPGSFSARSNESSPQSPLGVPLALPDNADEPTLRRLPSSKYSLTPRRSSTGSPRPASPSPASPRPGPAEQYGSDPEVNEPLQRVRSRNAALPRDPSLGPGGDGGRPADDPHAGPDGSGESFPPQGDEPTLRRLPSSKYSLTPRRSSTGSPRPAFPSLASPRPGPAEQYGSDPEVNEPLQRVRSRNAALPRDPSLGPGGDGGRPADDPQAGPDGSGQAFPPQGDEPALRRLPSSKYSLTPRRSSTGSPRPASPSLSSPRPGPAEQPVPRDGSDSEWNEPLHFLSGPQGGGQSFPPQGDEPTLQRLPSSKYSLTPRRSSTGSPLPASPSLASPGPGLAEQYGSDPEVNEPLQLVTSRMAALPRDPSLGPGGDGGRPADDPQAGPDDSGPAFPPQGDEPTLRRLPSSKYSLTPRRSSTGSPLPASPSLSSPRPGPAEQPTVQQYGSDPEVNEPLQRVRSRTAGLPRDPSLGPGGDGGRLADDPHAGPDGSGPAFPSPTLRRLPSSKYSLTPRRSSTGSPRPASPSLASPRLGPAEQPVARDGSDSEWNEPLHFLSGPEAGGQSFPPQDDEPTLRRLPSSKYSLTPRRSGTGSPLDSPRQVPEQDTGQPADQLQLLPNYGSSDPEPSPLERTRPGKFGTPAHELGSHSSLPVDSSSGPDDEQPPALSLLNSRYPVAERPRYDDPDARPLHSLPAGVPPPSGSATPAFQRMPSRQQQAGRGPDGYLLEAPPSNPGQEETPWRQNSLADTSVDLGLPRQRVAVPPDAVTDEDRPPVRANSSPATRTLLKQSTLDSPNQSGLAVDSNPLFNTGQSRDNSFVLPGEAPESSHGNEDGGTPGRLGRAGSGASSIMDPPWRPWSPASGPRRQPSRREEMPQPRAVADYVDGGSGFGSSDSDGDTMIPLVWRPVRRPRPGGQRKRGRAGEPPTGTSDNTRPSESTTADEPEMAPGLSESPTSGSRPQGREVSGSPRPLWSDPIGEDGWPEQPAEGTDGLNRSREGSEGSGSDDFDKVSSLNKWTPDNRHDPSPSTPGSDITDLQDELSPTLSIPDLAPQAGSAPLSPSPVLGPHGRLARSGSEPLFAREYSPTHGGGAGPSRLRNPGRLDSFNLDEAERGSRPGLPYVAVPGQYPGGDDSPGTDEDRFPEPEKRIPSGTEQRTPTGQKPGGWLPHALPASSDTGDEDEVPFTDNRKQLKSIKTKPSASPALNHSPSLPQRKEKKARPALQVSGGDPQSPGYNDYSSGEFNTSDDDLDTPGQVPFPPAEDQHCKPSAAVRPRPSRSFNTVRPDEPDNDGFGGVPESRGSSSTSQQQPQQQSFGRGSSDDELYRLPETTTSPTGHRSLSGPSRITRPTDPMGNSDPSQIRRPAGPRSQPDVPAMARHPSLPARQPSASEERDSDPSYPDSARHRPGSGQPGTPDHFAKQRQWPPPPEGRPYTAPIPGGSGHQRRPAGPGTSWSGPVYDPSQPVDTEEAWRRVQAQDPTPSASHSGRPATRYGEPDASHGGVSDVSSPWTSDGGNDPHRQPGPKTTSDGQGRYRVRPRRSAGVNSGEMLSGSEDEGQQLTRWPRAKDGQRRNVGMKDSPPDSSGGSSDSSGQPAAGPKRAPSANKRHRGSEPSSDSDSGGEDPRRMSLPTAAAAASAAAAAAQEQDGSDTTDEYNWPAPASHVAYNPLFPHGSSDQLKRPHPAREVVTVANASVETSGGGDAIPTVWRRKVPVISGSSSSSDGEGPSDTLPPPRRRRPAEARSSATQALVAQPRKATSTPRKTGRKRKPHGGRLPRPTVPTLVPDQGEVADPAAQDRGLLAVAFKAWHLMTRMTTDDAERERLRRLMGNQKLGLARLHSSQADNHSGPSSGAQQPELADRLWPRGSARTLLAAGYSKMGLVSDPQGRRRQSDHGPAFEESDMIWPESDDDTPAPPSESPGQPRTPESVSSSPADEVASVVSSNDVYSASAGDHDLAGPEAHPGSSDFLSSLEMMRLRAAQRAQKHALSLWSGQKRISQLQREMETASGGDDQPIPAAVHEAIWETESVPPPIPAALSRRIVDLKRMEAEMERRAADLAARLQQKRMVQVMHDWHMYATAEAAARRWQNLAAEVESAFPEPLASCDANGGPGDAGDDAAWDDDDLAQLASIVDGMSESDLAALLGSLEPEERAAIEWQLQVIRQEGHRDRRGVCGEAPSASWGREASPDSGPAAQTPATEAAPQSYCQLFATALQPFGTPPGLQGRSPYSRPSSPPDPVGAPLGPDNRSFCRLANSSWEAAHGDSF